VRADTVQRALDPAYAALALEGATDRERIIELVLRAVRAQTRFAALLSVHPDSLRGQRAIADPRYDASKVESLTVLRNTVPAFETAIASAVPSVGSIATNEPFVDGLLELLGGRALTAVVLPIAVAGATCWLVVGHRGSAGLKPEDVPDLLPLAAASSAALERLRQVRVRAATVPRHHSKNDASAELEITFEGRRSSLSDLRTAEAWNDLSDSIRDLVLRGMQTGQPGEEEQRELLIELGYIEADRLGRVDQAIEAWRSALAIDARDERVLDALQTTLTKHERWLECSRLLEQRVALADAPVKRTALLLELAAISHERLADDEGAVAAYERVLDHQPDNPSAIRELEALYAKNGQWEAMAALLLDRASRAADIEPRVAALESVARLYEEKSRDHRAAFLVWTAVLRNAPERTDVIDQLVRLAPNAGPDAIVEGGAVADEIEPVHPEHAAAMWALVATLLRGERRWGELVSLLERRSERESDPDRRSELAISLGELHDQIGSPPGAAIAAFERALVDEPESMSALVSLHALYRRTEAWAQLADLLPRRIAVTDGWPNAVVELWIELGNVLSDRLQRHDDALRAFAMARSLSPSNRAALQGSARVYQATGRTEELLDAKEGELDGATGVARATAYGELASGWEDRGRHDRAARCRRKQLAISPLDVAAHEGLVRVLRLDEQWSALGDAIGAFLPLVPQAERMPLLLELADIRDVRQGDVDAAIAAYSQVLALDANHPAALDRLSVLHDRAGQFQAALEILGRQLATTTAPRARGELLQRMGQVCLNAHDYKAARVHLEQALTLDVSNAGAHEGMAWLHVQDQALRQAGDALVRAAQLSDDRQDRLRRYLDAAWLYWHRLRDAERARTCLTAILAIDPEHTDAKAALTDLLADQREWQDLWPRLEQEVARSESDTSLAPAARAELLTRAARCALELDHFDKANALFARACVHDPSPALLLERADALHRGRSFEEAATAYAAIVEGGAGLDRALRVRVHRKLAEIATSLGRPAQARKHLLDVLGLEAEHVETLRDLVEIDLARGQFDDALVHLKLLATSATTEQRVGYLERIGDIYRERLHNAPRAISTYLEALELSKGNRRLLQRVLDVQTETGQWRAAVDTIRRFVDGETDAQRRASYHLAEAEIRRAELRDKPGALAAYERALDDLFHEQPPAEGARRRGLDTFLIVDGLMTADADWRALEKAYVRMIKRLPKDDPALVTLWHALGELYRTHIGNDEHALAAFEVAHSLDPRASSLRAKILTDLRAKLAPPPAPPPPVEPEPRAVTEEPTPLPAPRPPTPTPAPVPLPRAATPIPATLTPTPAPSGPPERPSAPLGLDTAETYRSIARASAAAGQIDEVWCVARTLVLTRRATDEERAFYMEYRPLERREATGMLDEDAWAFVRHADEDRTISAIFSQIWQSAALPSAQPAEGFELKPKERVHVDDGGRLIARICRYAAGVLDVALPEVYIQPRRGGRLLLANRVERGRLLPTIIVGRDLMSAYKEGEITSELAAMMAQLRPAYVLNVALHTVPELEAALGAAAGLVGRPDLVPLKPSTAPLRAAITTELQNRLLGPQLGALRGLVSRLERPDLTRWRNAVDATAQRAALLVCGELVATARMVATDPAISDPDLAGRRVEDVIAYSVSPKYFAARAQLGVSVVS